MAVGVDKAEQEILDTAFLLREVHRLNPSDEVPESLLEWKNVEEIRRVNGNL
jgi:hypothetical protein